MRHDTGLCGSEFAALEAVDSLDTRATAALTDHSRASFIGADDSGGSASAFGSDAAHSGRAGGSDRVDR